MQKLKYRAGNGFIISLIVLIVLMVTLLGNNSSSKNVLHNIIWGLFALIIVLFVFVFSTYLQIEDGELIYVNLLIFRKKVKINQITSLEKFTNIAFQKRIVVYFKEIDGQTKKFMIYDAFSQKTLSMFFKNLLDQNSRIILDEYCRKLIA